MSEVLSWDEKGEPFLYDEATGEAKPIADEDREQMIEDRAEQLLEYERLKELAPRLRDELAVLMKREQPYLATAGWAVVREAAPRPARSIIPAAIDEHAEALTEIHLGPVEQPPVKPPPKYPGVGDLTTARAKARLASIGLSPETFIHTPPDRPDTVRVYAPEREEAPHA